VQRRKGAVRDIESQMRLAVIGVGAVALETFIGKDRPDVEVVADRSVGCSRGVVVVVETGGKNENGSRDQG
jgi:hypothetical protein